MWRTPAGWTGHRSHLGNNKEAFDAEVYAIYHALRALDRRQESGRQCTIFSDSTAVVDMIRADTLDPGQRSAVTASEVFSRITARDNEVTVRWIPAHSTAPGNEKADEFAKAAASRSAPTEEMPDEYRWVTSLSHMTRGLHRGQVLHDGRVNRPQRQCRKTVQPSRGDWASMKAATLSAQGGGWPLLPATVQACSDQVLPLQQDLQYRHG